MRAQKLLPKRTLFSILVGLTVLSLLVVPAWRTFAQAEDPNFDCAHMTDLVFPHADAVQGWLTTDPATLESVVESKDLENRALVVASENVSLVGVDPANVWGCYRRTELSWAEKVDMLNNMIPAVLAEVLEGTGKITVTPYNEAIPTPTPTNTATATQTLTPTVTPTITMTASPTPTETTEPTLTASPTATATKTPGGMMFLPMVAFEMKVVPPTPTPTPTKTPVPVPYEIIACGQWETLDVTADRPGAWTTTDPQSFKVGDQDYTTAGVRALIESAHDYTLSTKTNTWSCYYKGTMSADDIAKLMEPMPGAIHITIDSAGVVRGIPVATE